MPSLRRDAHEKTTPGSAAEAYQGSEPSRDWSIPEIEKRAAHARAAVTEAYAAESALDAELQRERREMRIWLDRAANALEEGKDGLARAALQKREEHDAAQRKLASAHESARAACVSTRAELRALESLLATARNGGVDPAKPGTPRQGPGRDAGGPATPSMGTLRRA